jgi:hypothetical protein
VVPAYYERLGRGRQRPTPGGAAESDPAEHNRAVPAKAVPIKFLRTYAALRPPLTHGEALFILHLMTFKWDKALPYPSYKTLSRLMGVDQKTVQRYAQSLCRKKYLFRIFQPKGTNRFDLTNLFTALAKAGSIPVKRAYAADPIVEDAAQTVSLDEIEYVDQVEY